MVVTTHVVPSEGLVRLTHLIYGLHAFSAIMGIGAASIVTAFLTGWPSIIAVILNYVKRSDVRGTYLDSHFGWQIRTFWFALLWALVVGVVSAPLVLLLGLGFVTFFVGIAIVGFWVLYRIVRGWLALGDGKPMPA